MDYNNGANNKAFDVMDREIFKQTQRTRSYILRRKDKNIYAYLLNAYIAASATIPAHPTHIIVMIIMNSLVKLCYVLLLSLMYYERGCFNQTHQPTAHISSYDSECNIFKRYFRVELYRVYVHIKYYI